MDTNMTNIRIEKADKNDIPALGQLYDELNEYLEAHVNFPGWKKGIYPTIEDAEAGVMAGNLFAARTGGRIAGTVTLNHEPEKGYANADWHVDLEDEDVFIIHTLAVHPSFQGQGVGRKLMDFVLQHSRDNQIKAIRLDVNEKNTPAIRLYKQYGFQYIQKMDLGYGGYGLNLFELYQKLL